MFLVAAWTLGSSVSMDTRHLLSESRFMKLPVMVGVFQLMVSALVWLLSSGAVNLPFRYQM